jgi:hypothetical protein
MNAIKKDIKFWNQTIENLKKNNSPYSGELIVNIEKTIENLKKSS